eukprot:3084953-Alexandrium_andersonii.AAC.1
MHNAASGTFDTARESARKRPNVPESARKCSRHFRAVSKAPEAALRISCYAFGALKRKQFEVV